MLDRGALGAQGHAASRRREPAAGCGRETRMRSWLYAAGSRHPQLPSPCKSGWLRSTQPPAAGWRRWARFGRGWLRNVPSLWRRFLDQALRRRSIPCEPATTKSTCRGLSDGLIVRRPHRKGGLGPNVAAPHSRATGRLRSRGNVFRTALRSTGKPIESPRSPRPFASTTRRRCRRARPARAAPHPATQTPVRGEYRRWLRWPCRGESRPA